MSGRIPRFLQALKQNGIVKETHASPSMLFRVCSGDCKEEREFQLMSEDLERGIRIYRCVICGKRLEISNRVKTSERSE
jgi:hypothetical protein